MATLPVCIYVTGQPPSAVADRHGDYGRWFSAMVEQAGGTPATVDAREPSGPPDPRRFSGVVITGSAASLTAPEPWMEAGIELIREAARIGTPVLGVCFGHQMIGAAYGADVIANPAGWELSTTSVELTPAGQADPLFSGLPSRFDANQSHRDTVSSETVSPRNGIAVLASNRHGVQAIAAGDAIRGVQFHPEFSGEIARAYVAIRGSELPADARASLRPGQDTPAARQVFARWMEQFVAKTGG